MIRNIEITAVLNGFIVKVGCQTLIFQSPDALATELLHYLIDPDRTEDYYLEHSVNVGKLGLQPTRPLPQELIQVPGETRMEQVVSEQSTITR
jgi:hypothetical protein